MSDMLLSISPDYLYFIDKKPVKISNYHKPYFLAFTDSSKIDSARNRLIKKINDSNSETLSKIESIGEIEDYRSFCNFSKKRKVFRVYTKKSYFVPEVSDYLFFNYGLYTAEHDIPYHQRALVDLSVDEDMWAFDSKGQKKTLNVLVYDIETTKYGEGRDNVPVDMIGYANFNVCFESSKDLESEEFSFDIIDCPDTWQGIDINQVDSTNTNDEIDNLFNFCKKAIDADIISGHNIVGFDNTQIYDRLKWLLKTYNESISKEKKDFFWSFLNKYAREDKSFHFGIRNRITQFYPTSLDTYLGVRKFYSFLNEFSLKAVAPFLGINIKDRIVLPPSQINIDDRTRKYNLQDVQEQLGVTLNLIQQVLPLSFTTGMPFDMLLSSGAVNMWDHMSLIRGYYQKKIMPPICRVMSTAKTLVKYYKGCNTKEKIVKQSIDKKEQLSKELKRVVKYGSEMPEWMVSPYVIYNENAKDRDERLNYHFPGGMTIKPDKDANSHFIPWWYVVVADVGAMYPTILKAMNIGADTVRYAKSDEKPDDWIWLKKIPKAFFEKNDVKYRKVTEEDTYADKGYMIGVKIDKKPGVVNSSMTGIMNMISKVKKDLGEVKKTDDKEAINRLKMMYQSVKGARNAGTHGIISAPNVSGRQFNLWGAATITTKGQAILADTLDYLENKGIRVVYGDTDGIYLGCSKSMTSIPDFAKKLDIKFDEKSKEWITEPKVAFSAIEECNNKWRKELNYPEFELEPEEHDAMIFVKHKNYLIFDSKKDKIDMLTKGNNFKGSDKANIARIVLKEIMMEVLKEIPVWSDEEEARKKVRELIGDKTRDIVAKLDLSKVDIKDLTLVQSVQPASRYKPNQDGSLSTFAKRANALEKVLDEKIKSRAKFRFVVTKNALPGIPNPSKSGVKPIDYMFPVDLLQDKSQIDLDWYKEMIQNYIKGAFGLSDIAVTEQTGLDAWM